MIASRVNSLAGRYSRHGAESVNVTPMIDVVMCLIVFFLIVGKLASDERARVDLPTSAVGRAGGSERDRPVVISVAIDPNGMAWAGQLSPVRATITVDGKVVVDQSTLREALKKAVESRVKDAAGAEASGGVIVRGDRNLPYEAVEPVLSACAALGVVRVDYATERVEENTGGGGGNP